MMWEQALCCFSFIHFINDLPISSVLLQAHVWICFHDSIFCEIKQKHHLQLWFRSPETTRVALVLQHRHHDNSFVQTVTEQGTTTHYIRI